LRSRNILKITQTITYLPHFLSEVTVTGIVLMLVNNGVQSTGVIAQFFVDRGWLDASMQFMQKANYFRPLYIITGIWKESGYDSIVYFAAIMGISPTLYEALKVDGGDKLQEIRYVTIPGMAPTLIIMIIMRIGKMMSIGYERVLLLYNANIYNTADVLSTFEQRIGILTGNYGIGSATSLFNSLIAFALVLGAIRSVGTSAGRACGRRRTRHEIRPSEQKRNRLQDPFIYVRHCVLPRRTLPGGLCVLSVRFWKTGI
jgi:putative aldouronate transport system permease protein